jgi:hypothetical protein
MIKQYRATLGGIANKGIPLRFLGSASLQTLRMGSFLRFPSCPRVDVLFCLLHGLGIPFLGHLFTVKSLFKLFEALAETPSHLRQAFGPEEEEDYQEKEYEVRG